MFTECCLFSVLTCFHYSFGVSNLIALVCSLFLFVHVRIFMVMCLLHTNGKEWCFLPYFTGCLLFKSHILLLYLHHT